MIAAVGARTAAPIWRSAIAPAPDSAKKALSSCLEQLAWPDDEAADLALLSVPLAHARQVIHRDPLGSNHRDCSPLGRLATRSYKPMSSFILPITTA